MKKFNKILALIIAAVFMLSCIPVSATDIGSTDTGANDVIENDAETTEDTTEVLEEPPALNAASTTITATGFTVDNPRPDLNESTYVRFHVKAPKGKVVSTVYVTFYANKKIPVGNITVGAVQYSLGTSTWGVTNMENASNEMDVEMPVCPAQYGTWRIKKIKVVLADGGTKTFYNKLLSDSGIDMSGSTFSVANNPGDTTAPVVSGPYTSSPESIKVLENGTISFKANDDNKIIMVQVYRCNMTTGSEGCTEYFIGDNEDNMTVSDEGVVTIPFFEGEAGIYQIGYISVVDSSLNVTSIKNSKCKVSGLGSFSRQADMSGANIYVKSAGKVKERHAPVVREDTLRTKDYRVEYGGRNEISIAVYDESEIRSVMFDYAIGSGKKRENWGLFAEYDPETDRYVADFGFISRIGEWRLMGVVAEDKYGNWGIIGDKSVLGPGQSYDPDPGTVRWMDLSIGNFLCGLKDVASDVFVTGEGMDTSAQLSVDELDEDDPEYEELVDAMLEERFEDDSLYKIEMEGKYNQNNSKVNVAFPMEEFSNGDRIRIRHLKDDGTIETRETVVKKGMAEMSVDSFSPFLIEKPNFKDIFKAKVEGVKTSIRYSGKSYKPALKVTYEGEELVEGRDYTVKYGANKNIGQGYVKITGIGDYGYSRTIYIRIIPKGTILRKVTAGKRSFKAYWSRQSSKMSKARVTGYQIQYSLKKNFSSGNKAKTVKGYKNTYVTVSNLKAKKSYYVRIRTYYKSGGKTFYSAWSKAKRVTT